MWTPKRCELCLSAERYDESDDRPDNKNIAQLRPSGQSLRNGPAMLRDKSRKAVYVYAAANAGISLTTSINSPELIS